MALSSLVPQTVSSISLLAKSTITGLQIWSLYGLLLTIEASGFSYVSHVQVLEFVHFILFKMWDNCIHHSQSIYFQRWLFINFVIFISVVFITSLFSLLNNDQSW